MQAVAQPIAVPPHVRSIEGGKLDLYTAIPNREEVALAAEHEKQAELKDMSKHVIVTCGYGSREDRQPFICISLDPLTTMPNDNCDVSGWEITCGPDMCDHKGTRLAVLPQGSIVRHGQPLTVRGWQIDPQASRAHISLFKPTPNYETGREIMSFCSFPVQSTRHTHTPQHKSSLRNIDVMRGVWIGWGLMFILWLCCGVFSNRDLPTTVTATVTPIEAFQQLDVTRSLRTNETELQSINPNLFASIEEGHLTVQRYLGAQRVIGGNIKANVAPHMLWSMPLYSASALEADNVRDKKFVLGFDLSGRLVARVQGSLSDSWRSKTCDGLADGYSVSCRCSYMELADNGKLIVYNGKGEKVMVLNDVPEQTTVKNNLVVGK